MTKDLPLALAYCRVSTNRQEEAGHSLDSQAALLIAAAEAQGYRVEIVAETGSGRRASRPALNAALDRLSNGQAQALFAIDIDRLARSVKHLSEIMDTARRRKWRLVIATADIDTATPNGELLLGLLAQFAQFESRMIGERVKRQHQARRDRGITWGVEQGYKGQLNPATRTLIASLHTQGHSLRAIASELTKRGLQTPRGGLWHAESIRAILNSPQTARLAEVA
jgi:DNA invertase Pin-like site-specific DNA recombinase